MEYKKPALFCVYSKDEQNNYYKTYIEFDNKIINTIRRTFYLQSCTPTQAFEEENTFFADLYYEGLAKVDFDEVQFVVKRELIEGKRVFVSDAYGCCFDYEQAYKFVINKYKKVRSVEDVFDGANSIERNCINQFSDVDEKKILKCSGLFNAILQSTASIQSEKECLQEMIGCFRLKERQLVNKSEIIENIIERDKFSYLTSDAQDMVIGYRTVFGRLKNKMTKFDKNDPKHLDTAKVYSLRKTLEDKIVNDEVLQKSVKTETNDRKLVQ